MSSIESDIESCIILYHPHYWKNQPKRTEQPFMDQNLDINMATQALALAPFGVCITDANDQLVYGNKTLFQIFQVEDSEQTQDLIQLPALADAIKNKEAYIELDAQNDTRKRTIKCWHHEATAGCSPIWTRRSNSCRSRACIRSM